MEQINFIEQILLQINIQLFGKKYHTLAVKIVLVPK